jgi:hypothetical protein
VKTWRGRPATNSSGSDNLLARVWAPISWKYSLFGMGEESRSLYQRHHGHASYFAVCDPLSSCSYSVQIDALNVDPLPIFHAAFYRLSGVFVIVSLFRCTLEHSDAQPRLR